MAELDEIWQRDCLDRRADAAWLATFLRNRSAELARLKEARSYVLNLDAQWGTGKTFFLTRLKEQLESASHLAVYVNAWRDDFADDPLVAVMAAIDETVEVHRELTPDVKAKWLAVKEKAGKVALIAGKGLLRRGIGLLITNTGAEAAEAAMAAIGVGNEEQVGKMAEAVADATVEGIERAVDAHANEAVDDFRKEQHSIQAFRENLAAFVIAVETTQGKAAPFFVLIDELDRCRPPYAIAMLERIKHLFETPGVVFVVATDSRQLGHSIRAVYGADFESSRYLRRFFDQTYEFTSPRLADFVNYLMERSPIDLAKLSSPWENDHAAFLSGFLTSTETDLRTAEQVYDHLHSLTTAWQDVVPIELVVALPLISAFARRERINDLAQTLKDYSPKGQRLSWEEYNENSQRMETKADSAHSLAQIFGSLSNQSLEDIARTGNRGGRLDSWARDRLRNELQQRLGGVLYQGRHTSPLIWEYPQRISQAGRVKSALSAN